MKLKINVTANDIKKGGYEYNDSALAIALKRRLKTKVHKFVAVRPRGRNFIYVGKTKFPLEQKLLTFVKMAESGRENNLKPTTFELNIPDKYVR